MTTPLYLKLKYNNRFQMVDARLADRVSTNDTVDWNRGKLMFFYGANAVTNNNPLLDSVTNNGNVIRSAHYVPTTVDASGNITASVVASRQDYTYDDLNRIASVTEQQLNTAGSVSTSAAQGFGYDRYGNRTINAVTGPVNGQSLTFNQTTNRINMAGYVYDLAGNLINQSGATRTYDIENRMVSATGGSYVYDGDGKRVKRTANSQTWCYVYGIGGELLAEYLSTAPTAVQKEYGYRGGQLLVVWDTSQTGDKKWKWLVTDHLGSTRMETDKSGTLAGITRHDYLPFGEELFNNVGSVRSGNGYEASPPTTNVRKKFGTYERDSETGLDFAQARYYANVQGRFTSVDPVFFQKEMPTDPQRFNLYAYSRNNPLKFRDPKGEAIELIGDELQRRKILSLLKEAVGSKAGAYLYENAITGEDGKTRYFVGIRDHKGGAFGKINKVSGFIEKLILHENVAKVSLAARGERVEAYGKSVNIGMRENDAGPGWTNLHISGEATVALMNPSNLINGVWAAYPGIVMEDNEATLADPSDVLVHELGHVYASWFSMLMPDRGGNYTSVTGDFAVQFENMSRRLKNPNAPLRVRHNSVFLEPPMSPGYALPYNP